MKVLNLLLHLLIVLLQHSSNIGTKTKVNFCGSCLKQDKVTFTDGKIVNIDTVYEVNLWNYEDM